MDNQVGLHLGCVYLKILTV